MRYVYQTQLNNTIVCFNERRFTTPQDSLMGQSLTVATNEADL